jgi:hypothetical protein
LINDKVKNEEYPVKLALAEEKKVLDLFEIKY